MSGLEDILGNEKHLLQQMLGDDEVDWREHAGSKIGKYELTKKLGEGGFGVVWKARQRRQVALKLIKVGMDTLQVLTRFDLERQVLASMEHPHIASLLDAGATKDGRPFFVMELVMGEPIHHYCERKDLTLTDRLDLFQKVCHAVQHAHQKGIIHRDLKPSNILVTEDKEGVPSPKIIDFGIAKAMSQQQFMDVTLMTRQDVLIGTPLYMSPEQLQGESDVDTRADIYSMGVVLYELLTGEQPYDMATGSEVLLKRLKEDAPARPSTRVTARLKRGARVAPDLRAERTGIPLDLDWITMRAMEKDRQRRYPSAAELAADVRRFLANEPVLARPPSVAYLTGRWVQRNRTLFLAACICLLALVAGTVVSVWQAQLAFAAKQAAEAQRAVAENLRGRAEEAAAQALRAENLALKESARQKEAASFLTALLDNVADQVGKGRNPEALRLGLQQTQPMLHYIKDDPTLRAELLSRTAKLWDSMGERKHAIPMLQTRAELMAEIHGADSELARDAQMSYLRMMGDHGARQEVVPLLNELLQKLQASGEVGSKFWFEVQRELVRIFIKVQNIAGALSASELLMKEARERKIKGKHLFHCLMARQWALQSAGKFSEAEQLLTECRRVAEMDKDRAKSEQDVDKQLLVLYKQSGEFKKGAALQSRLILQAQQELGEWHINLVAPLVSLSDFETKAGEHASAVLHARQALAQAERTDGSAVDQTSSMTHREERLLAMNQLTLALTGAKQFDEAIQQGRAGLEVSKLIGNKDTHHGALSALALAYRAAGMLEEAFQYMEQCSNNRAQRDLNYRARWDDKRELSLIRIEQKKYGDALRIAEDNWRDNLMDEGARNDLLHMSYCAQLAIGCWEAYSKSATGVKEPADLAAWRAAVAAGQKVPSQ